MSLLMAGARRRTPGTPHAADVTPFESSSGVNLTTTVEETAYLIALAGYPNTELTQLATSVQGRPVYSLRVGASTGSSAVVISGQHGNEPASREAALMFARELVTTTDAAVQSWLSTRRVFVIPTLNPDGRVANKRENANNVDLNRDWLKLSQPENMGVMTFLADEAPFVAMDAHEFPNPDNPNIPYVSDISYAAIKLKAATYPFWAAGQNFLLDGLIPWLTAAGIDNGWYVLDSGPSATMFSVCMPLRGCQVVLHESAQRVTPWVRAQRQLTGMRGWLDYVVTNSSTLEAQSAAFRDTTAQRTTSDDKVWELVGRYGDPVTAESAGSTTTAIGYSLTAEQYTTVADALTAHNLTATTTDGGVTYQVMLAGSPDAVIATQMLDQNSWTEVVAATRIYAP